MTSLISKEILTVSNTYKLILSKTIRKCCKGFKTAADLIDLWIDLLLKGTRSSKFRSSKRISVHLGLTLIKANQTRLGQKSQSLEMKEKLLLSLVTSKIHWFASNVKVVARRSRNQSNSLKMIIVNVADYRNRKMTSKSCRKRMWGNLSLPKRLQ